MQNNILPRDGKESSTTVHKEVLKHIFIIWRMLISKAVIPLILSHKHLCFSLREALAVPEIQLLDELMETFFSADAKPHIANTDCVF